MSCDVYRQMMYGPNFLGSRSRRVVPRDQLLPDEVAELAKGEEVHACTADDDLKEMAAIRAEGNAFDAGLVGAGGDLGGRFYTPDDEGVVHECFRRSPNGGHCGGDVDRFGKCMRCKKMSRH